MQLHLCRKMMERPSFNLDSLFNFRPITYLVRMTILVKLPDDGRLKRATAYECAAQILKRI